MVERGDKVGERNWTQILAIVRKSQKQD
jgi:hypothetical protein